MYISANMDAVTDLTPRQIQILKAIIDEYIATAEAVGSETLEKKHSLGVSPATIRNEMVRLTELGMLSQPHTSSGRAPTPIALKYYVDQLRVFRYVKNRDSNWVTYTRFTDDVDPQWKQVMKEIGTEVVYALSPQAKGKIERPYRWLQDHLVRTFVREGVTTTEEGRELLKKEVNDYNWRRVHSTTGEIPMRRFEAAISEGKSLWRPFEIIPPYQSVIDIFCLRTKRIVDPYRQVSINNLKLKVPAVLPRQEVELRLSLDAKKGVVEIRFWFKGNCVGQQVVKSQDLPGVHF